MLRTINFTGRSIISKADVTISIEKINKIIPTKQMAVHIPTDVHKQIKKYKGYGIIAVGMDTTILLEGYRELQ